MHSFNIANLPKKITLSGADCFHLVLDKHAKKHGAGGNVMRKVFYFTKTLEFKKIEHILKSSAVIYWLCNIKLNYGTILNPPCWKFTDAGNEIVVNKHHLANENDIPEIILTRNITVESKSFIEADLIYYPSGKCAFVLSWNHIVLDAKGTALLFEHLNQLTTNTPQNTELYFPSKTKKHNVFQHIKNMYKIKHFVQVSAKPPVSSVASFAVKSHAGKTFTKNISFNADETKKIHANAIKAGARFGPNLYFIACCAHVIHFINKKRNNDGDLWIPVPYDARLKGAIGPVISNCVSFLFYRIPKNKLTDVAQTVKYLGLQMTGQIKDSIPQKYSMFLNFMRHIPLWLYYFLINNTNKGVFASFLYTSTGDNFTSLKYLFGEPVDKINMIPALTFPPGLTFLFLNHIDNTNINIAYSSEIINNNELVLIEEKIKEILLTNY
ncbi:MAG TPA: hypothetical protein PK987_01555 [Ferruginibacter sp.]|nr:hypothetical protein [Ferruginibacter sp.]